MKQDTRKRHPQLFESGQDMKMNVSANFLINDGRERVLRMTMVLPTFPKRKVGRTEGYSGSLCFIGKTPLKHFNA